MHGKRRGILAGGLLGASAGLVAGAVLVAAASGSGTAGRAGPPAVEATHLPPLLTTDLRRLQQVLKNLLSNALKFTEKGSVTLRMHRVTVEQMAILEPAVVESTMATCITVLREAMETAVAMGVPRQAAEDFCLGHIRTELAIIFGFAGFPLSDGAMKAIEQNRPRIFRDDWKQVITIPALKESVREICEA